MNCELRPGRYIAAVSGGVDSMVMLDVVRRLPGVELIVAHVNHGIRNDSTEDQELVRSVSMSHNMICETIDLRLGPYASEQLARDRRYNFLRHLRKKYNAQAVLTAHHKDDVLETAIINLIRGTGWRGLSSLRSTGDVLRPLLGSAKKEIIQYAHDRNIKWRQDTTNNDTKYLRNYVRHRVLPQLSADSQQKMYEYIVRQNELTTAIDTEISDWIIQHVTSKTDEWSLPRYDLIMMPGNVAHEIIQTIMRVRAGSSILRPLAERVLLFARVAKADKTFQINRDLTLRATTRQIIVQHRSDVLSLDNVIKGQGFNVRPNILNSKKDRDLETKATK